MNSAIPAINMLNWFIRRKSKHFFYGLFVPEHLARYKVPVPYKIVGCPGDQIIPFIGFTKPNHASLAFKAVHYCFFQQLFIKLSLGQEILCAPGYSFLCCLAYQTGPKV